jgi:pyruvyltransferase
MTGVDAYWFRPQGGRGLPNFGDALNPFLLQRLCGVKAHWIHPDHWYRYPRFYMCIGSILGRAKPNTIVWGSGFGTSSNTLTRPPLQICAVRGPATRERLLSLGMTCPEVYGDPALLLPRVYRPIREKTHHLGIVPHYVDKDNDGLRRLQEHGDLKVIDVEREDVLEVVNEILSCELVASSSLHGIVVADAYGVLSTWLEFSDKVVGEGFKFRDYFRSVHRDVTRPLAVDRETTVAGILDSFQDYRIEIDLDELLAACPLGRRTKS